MNTSVWRRLGVALTIGALCFGIAVTDAQAGRLGGGRTIGRQNSGMMQPRPPGYGYNYSAPARPAAPQPAPPPMPQPQRFGWGGMFGGIAAGLGLGWLMSHFGGYGMGGGFGFGWLPLIVLAAIAFWVIASLRRRTAEPTQQAYQPPYEQPYQQPYQAPYEAPPSYPSAAPVANSLPPDFDEVGFVRNAKVYFVRMQAAWDAGNLDDIREFTTPEMFAEIRVDLADRGAAPNVTDVVTLDAQLLGVEATGHDWLASVRFTGMLREAQGAAAQPFAEVWNLVKPIHGPGGWVLAGIQQVQ